MEMIIRGMTAGDREEVLAMMRVFYASPAVLSNGSEEIFESDVEHCLNESPYLEGYVFESGQGICGYAMVAKSFSTEFGKPCKWIEDLYLKKECRGSRIGTRFLQFLEQKYPDSILRLEVEEENERAVNVYQKNGYRLIGYSEMIKL